MKKLTEEIIKKLEEIKNRDGIDDYASFAAEAEKLGYTGDEIKEAMDDLEICVLDDDKLNAVSGGVNIYVPPHKNDQSPFYEWYWENKRKNKL